MEVFLLPDIRLEEWMWYGGPIRAILESDGALPLPDEARSRLAHCRMPHAPADLPEGVQKRGELAGGQGNLRASARVFSRDRALINFIRRDQKGFQPLMAGVVCADPVQLMING